RQTAPAGPRLTILHPLFLLPLPARPTQLRPITSVPTAHLGNTVQRQREPPVADPKKITVHSERSDSCLLHTCASSVRLHAEPLPWRGLRQEVQHSSARGARPLRFGVHLRHRSSSGRDRSQDSEYPTPRLLRACGVSPECAYPPYRPVV